MSDHSGSLLLTNEKPEQIWLDDEQSDGKM